MKRTHPVALRAREFRPRCPAVIEAPALPGRAIACRRVPAAFRLRARSERNGEPIRTRKTGCAAPAKRLLAGARGGANGHRAAPAGEGRVAAGGNRLRLFALQATAELGKSIAEALGEPLAAHEERNFEDGEHKARPLENVRGADVYVVHSLHGGPTASADDKLCR